MLDRPGRPQFQKEVALDRCDGLLEPERQQQRPHAFFPDSEEAAELTANENIRTLDEYIAEAAAQCDQFDDWAEELPQAGEGPKPSEQ